MTTTPSQRRWLVVATALVAARGGDPIRVGQLGRAVAPSRVPWTPAADVMAFGPALAGTVRMVGPDVEVLHRVTCTNHTERWLWMPGSYDGSP